MHRPAQTAPRPRRALRGALAVAVLAGYLAALGGTAAGHGWKLVSHLALHHAGPMPVAPTLYSADGQKGGRALTTLRPTAPHTHGGVTHAHGQEHTGHEPLSTLFSGRHTAQPEAAGDPGLHRHDGVLHSHEAPPPEPAVVVTVSLDKHRLPAAAAVPAPLAVTLADLGEGIGAPESVDPSVETPPPIGRG